MGQKETLFTTPFHVCLLTKADISASGLSMVKAWRPAGVIGTRLYESHPPRYEYFLTDKGMALGPVLKALYTWGGRHG